MFFTFDSLCNIYKIVDLLLLKAQLFLSILYTIYVEFIIVIAIKDELVNHTIKL